MNLCSFVLTVIIISLCFVSDKELRICTQPKFGFAYVLCPLYIHSHTNQKQKSNKAVN